MRDRATAKCEDVLFQLVQLGAAQQRRLRGMARMIAVVDRRAEHCDDGVADVFVDIAALALDDIGHGREIFIDEGDQLGRRHLLGDRGKAFEVGKEHGDVSRLAAEIGQLVGSQHAVDHLRRQIQRETPA